MGAMALKTPELVITDDQAKVLAEAMERVAEHYPISLDPKMMAWAQLIMVMFGVYGIKVMAIHQRRKGEQNQVAQTAQPIPSKMDLHSFSPGQGTMPS